MRGISSLCIDGHLDTCWLIGANWHIVYLSVCCLWMIYIKAEHKSGLPVGKPTSMETCGSKSLVITGLRGSGCMF